MESTMAGTHPKARQTVPGLMKTHQSIDVVVVLPLLTGHRSRSSPRTGGDRAGGGALAGAAGGQHW